MKEESNTELVLHPGLPLWPNVELIQTEVRKALLDRVRWVAETLQVHIDDALKEKVQNVLDLNRRLFEKAQALEVKVERIQNEHAAEIRKIKKENRKLKQRDGDLRLELGDLAEPYRSVLEQEVNRLKSWVLLMKAIAPEPPPIEEKGEEPIVVEPDSSPVSVDVLSERPPKAAAKNVALKVADALSHPVDRLDLLEEELAKLRVTDKRLWQVVQFRFYREWTYKEIGAKLGVSNGRARQLLYRAFSILRYAIRKRDREQDVDLFA